MPGGTAPDAVDPETLARSLDKWVGELAGLADLPVGDHVGRFEGLHGALADALSGIDEV
jgi:hypothetical protein